MVRFRCIHCGGRIAVHRQRLGRLARCPDCGGVTHPLAEHLAGPPASETTASKPAHPMPRARQAGLAASSTGALVINHPQTTSKLCANCGLTLGKLQQTRSWENHAVCATCFNVLTDEFSSRRSQMGNEIIAIEDSGRYPVQTATPRAVLVERTRPAARPSEVAPAFRNAGLGLFATAAALFLLVAVLHAIGVLLAWATIAAAFLVCVYWIRRSVLATRRRFAGERNAIHAIVR